MPSEKAHIVSQLQNDILLMQGFKPAEYNARDLGLGCIKEAFPNATFPIGAVHEFLAYGKENSATTCGFIAGLLSSLMINQGTLLWISSSRTLFPPALKSFGVEPDRVIFIDLKKENDVLWAMDEALKCAALAAVVGEMRDMSFTASRRLQLAVEQSQVTGFVIRNNPFTLKTTACVSRWKVSPLPSEVNDFPGIGFPQWNVELLRIKNGRPGVWKIKWLDGRFELPQKDLAGNNKGQERRVATSAYYSQSLPDKNLLLSSSALEKKTG